MINQELPKKKRIIKSEKDNSVNRNVKPKKISNPQIPKKQNTQIRQNKSVIKSRLIKHINQKVKRLIP